MDGNLSGSAVHGIFQARILEWGATCFSRGSSQPRDRTRVSCIAERCFTLWATREAPDATKYMNMGNDWKNRRRHMLRGETLGMEQSIPVAISRETRVSEIQHFIWVPVKQLRSCTKLSPPSALRCAPAAGMCTWTLSNGPDAPPGPAPRTPAQDPGENRGVPVKSLDPGEAPP